MSELPRTLGELVDRLSILNIKLYVVQDRVHEAAEKGEGLDAQTVGQLAALNKDRNRTMTALDQLLAESLLTGKTPVDPRVKTS